MSTVRVHVLNPLTDLFGAGEQELGKHSWSAHAALKQIGESEQGVFVWIEDGRAVDASEALNKCREGQSVHQNSEPYRSIGVGAQILRQLGVKDMRLLSSSAKFNISGFDLNIVETVSA